MDPNSYPPSANCVCGCDSAWSDPEGDEYLDSHVECDECGWDFPIDNATVEHEAGHPDNEVYTRYYCPQCTMDATHGSSGHVVVWPHGAPRFPQVRVQLVGEDGNAFSILARVQREMRRAGLGDLCGAFYDEATSGDYQNLLATVARWVSIDEGGDE